MLGNPHTWLGIASVVEGRAGLDISGVTGAGAALKVGRSAERGITAAVRAEKAAERLRAANPYKNEVADAWARFAARRKEVAVARGWKVRQGEADLLGLTGLSSARDQWLAPGKNPGQPYPLRP